MFTATVLPWLQRKHAAGPSCFAAFRTAGVPESELAERLRDVIAGHTTVTWAFYPGWGGVDVKLRRAGSPDATWEELCRDTRAVLGSNVYSENPDESLAEVVQHALVAHGWTLAVAESCTGGLLGARLTDPAGASACFTGGFITYANEAKERWLDVPAEVLRVHGAVSAECALAMARGARRRASSDIAVAVTGIAGPTGGTPEKPVGLVFLALDAEGAASTRRLQLFTQRELNRYAASQLALDMVRRFLAGLPAGDPAPGDRSPHDPPRRDASRGAPPSAGRPA